MRDIGGFIWIVFVLFAVISSIVRSARKASQQRPSSPVVSSAPQVNRPSQTPARTQVIVQLPQLQPQPQRLPQPAAPAPPPPPEPSPVVVQAPTPPIPQRRAKGMFSDRRALVRGIIAAEVLGKPLALRDE